MKTLEGKIPASRLRAKSEQLHPHKLHSHCDNASLSTASRVFDVTVSCITRASWLIIRIRGNIKLLHARPEP